MSGKRRFLKAGMAKNIMFLTMMQGVNYLLPLVTIPFLFRVLGAERYGLVAFGYAFIQYFIIITDFGFNLSSVKFVSENRDKPQTLNHHVNSVIISRLFLSLCCFLVLLSLCFTFKRFSEEKWFFISFFGMVLGNALFPLWYFQGIERMKYVTIINVSAKALSVVPFFFLIRNPLDYYQVPIFYSIGYLLAGGYSIYLLYFKMGLRFYFVKLQTLVDVLKESSGYFLSRASLSLFTTSNAFVLGLVSGNVFVGYYSVAEKLYQAFNNLVYPVNGVMFPHMAKTRDVIFFKMVVSRIVVLNIFAVSIMLLMSPFIVQLLFDTNHPLTLNALKILLLACFFTIPSVLIGYPFLAAMGHPKFTNFTVVFAAIIHILGLTGLLIAGKVTVLSVAIMVVFTELVLFLVRIYGVYKYSLFSVKKI